MRISTKYTNVEEKTTNDGKINSIKSTLFYEDGMGIRKKGYYICTVPCFVESFGTVLLPKLSTEKMIINLQGKRNTKVVKEDAEIMFETERDNLEKYLIATLSLIKK